MCTYVSLFVYKENGSEDEEKKWHAVVHHSSINLIHLNIYIALIKCRAIKLLTKYHKHLYMNISIKLNTYVYSQRRKVCNVYHKCDGYK